MIDFFFDYGYVGLFLAAFLAATVVPIASEVLFSVMIVNDFNVWLCIIVGGIGNWAGGMVNYYIGRMGKIEWAEKYLKIKKSDIERIQGWVKRKGASVAFFSFLPIVGDLIALVLGFLRANIYIVAITMFIGKVLRYFILGFGLSLM